MFPLTPLSSPAIQILCANLSTSTILGHGRKLMQLGSRVFAGEDALSCWAHHCQQGDACRAVSSVYLFNCSQLFMTRCGRIVESLSYATWKQAIWPTSSKPTGGYPSILILSCCIWGTTFPAWLIQMLIWILLKGYQRLCFHQNLRRSIPGIHHFLDEKVPSDPF